MSGISVRMSLQRIFFNRYSVNGYPLRSSFNYKYISSSNINNYSAQKFSDDFASDFNPKRPRKAISSESNQDLLSSISRAKSILTNKTTQESEPMKPSIGRKARLFSFDEPSSPIVSPLGRHVPRNSAEVSHQLRKKISMPRNSKVIKVAVLGLPNSGKSTLINALMDVKVCSASKRIHTTQCLARAVINHNKTQMVFLDTPGIVTPDQAVKLKLAHSLVKDGERSLSMADVAVVVYDCSTRYSKMGLHPTVLRLLALHPTLPVLLVLNKTDLIKSKVELLNLTRLLTDGVVDGTVSHSHVTPPSRSLIDKSHSPEDVVDALIKVDGSDCGNEMDDMPLDFTVDSSVILKTDRKKDTREIFTPSFGEGIIKPESSVPKVVSLLEKHSSYEDIDEEAVFEGMVRLSEVQVSDFIQGRKGWPKFQNVLMTSALEETGVDDLKTILMSYAKKAPWVYPSSMVTDQDPYQLAVQIVREKFMDKLKHQLPYSLRYEVEHWDVSDTGFLQIGIRVTCERAGVVKLLVGAKGCHIKKIAKKAEQDLINMFKTDVQLRINVHTDAVASEEVKQ